MTNRQSDDAQRDPRSVLIASLRRDGLTESEIETLVAEMQPIAAGSAVAKGDNRAARAARAVVSQFPIGSSIVKARGILIDVEGPGDLELWEVESAAQAIHQAANPDAQILVGALTDERPGEAVRVAVIGVRVDS